MILGNPVHDKTITSAHNNICVDSQCHSTGVADQGRGSACSSTAPALSGPVARTIYYIAAELVRLMGSVESMRPVLQSLYHRILLYAPPQNRVEAIKIMKEVSKVSKNCLIYSVNLKANLKLIIHFCLKTNSDNLYTVIGPSKRCSVGTH